MFEPIKMGKRRKTEALSEARAAEAQAKYLDLGIGATGSDFGEYFKTGFIDSEYGTPQAAFNDRVQPGFSQGGDDVLNTGQAPGLTTGVIEGNSQTNNPQADPVEISGMETGLLEKRALFEGALMRQGGLNPSSVFNI